LATIVLKDIRKSFASVRVLHGIDVAIQDHEFIVLIGPSGCGKTTLLRIIAGLELPTSGHILIDDEDVTNLPPARREVAKVFQSYALYPHMSVYENMAFGLKVQGWRKKHLIQERIQEVARILQLESLLTRKPRELSGGQRQRVAIGRAIVRNPKVFLFDEPLSNLDASLRAQMRLELANLKAQLHATMIYVTHDQVEAMTLADRIVVMRDGKIEQIGTPLEIYNQPANQFVAGFMGSPPMNFLSGTIVKNAEGENVLRLADGVDILLPVLDVAIGKTVTIGIRPEAFSVNHESTELSPLIVSLKGKIIHLEHLGAESYAHVRLQQGSTLIVRTVLHLHVGEDLAIAVSLAKCHFFNQEGQSLSQKSMPLSVQKQHLA